MAMLAKQRRGHEALQQEEAFCIDANASIYFEVVLWKETAGRLAHWRGFDRMRFLVELVNLLLVFGLNHAALEF